MYLWLKKETCHKHTNSIAFIRYIQTHNILKHLQVAYLCPQWRLCIPLFWIYIISPFSSYVFSDQTAINNASCPSYFHPHLRHKSAMDTDFPPAIKLVLPCGAAFKRHKIEATKDTYDSVPPKDPYYSDKNRKKEKRRGCILSVVYHPSRDWNLRSFPPR